MDALVQLLRSASEAYYNGAAPLLTDEEYDAKLDELRAMNPSHSYLMTIGAPPSRDAAPLLHPMPSLDKVKPGTDALRRFLEKSASTGICLSEKLDGLSALWNSDAQTLFLRGDGLTGQNISHLVPLGIQGLRPLSGVSVRGELVLPRSLTSPGQIARSWVNGQVHQKQPSASEIRKIRFVAYQILPSDQTVRQQFQTLASAGFEVAWNTSHPSVSVSLLQETLLSRRNESPYDTDGIVVSQEIVPPRAKKLENPKHSVAFKMPLLEQSAETTVLEVLWAPSAQGYLIPRLKFEPVVISGAEIQYCSAHNARNIVDQDLGPGAKIMIRRSGDVIPTLDRVLTSTSAQLPKEYLWVWDGPETSATHLRLVTSAKTDEMAASQMVHFAKKLEISGLGPGSATKLVKKDIFHLHDLYKASQEELQEAVGDKNGVSLYQNLRTALSKATELQLMVASSKMSRGVGETKLEALFAAEPDPRRWNLRISVPGWSKESLQAFLIDSLPAYETWRTSEFTMTPYPILPAQQVVPTLAITAKGMICCTGFRDASMETTLSAQGWTFTDTLKKGVTHLLVKEGTDLSGTGSGKIQKAREMGSVQILMKKDFLAKIAS